MIESIITKKTVIGIYKSRAFSIVFSWLTGLSLGLFHAYRLLSDPMLVFGIMLPIIIVVTGFSIFIGIKIGIRRYANTKFILTKTHFVHEGFKKNVKLDVKKIIEIKKKSHGIIVVGSEGKILVQKQVPNYSKILDKLEEYVSGES